MTYSHDQIIDGTILCQAVVIFCYLISSFVIATNYYGGGMAVLTGIVFAAFCGLTYYGLRRNISRTLFGVILGGTFILVFVSLESAIFWGQYGSCDEYVFESDKSSRALRSEDAYTRKLTIGVECHRQSAMKSVCAFSVFMFLSYLFTLGVMMKFKDDILGTAPLNEGGYSVVSTVASEPGDGRISPDNVK